MKVKERMSPEPVTVAPEATVDQALGLMSGKGVRHLPVVKGDRLVGLVNDGQLRGAWFPSLIEELSVKDVMTENPETVQAEDTVYQAARVLYHNKLTGLPVLEDGHLVGIITLADILGLFVSLLGLLQDSTCLDVGLKPGQSPEDVHRLVRQQGGDVISVALVSSGEEGRAYSFRLEKTEPGPLEDAVRAAGYEVLS